MRLKILIFGLIMTVASQAQTGTLIVLNKSDDTADLIDLKSGKSKATLSTGNGPHEVAVSPDGKLAVVTNYGRGDQWPGSSLTVIDVAQKQVIEHIKLNFKAPHGIEFISDNQLLVTCEADKKLIQVNLKTGIVEKAIDTQQETSHMVAFAKTSNKAFVTNIRSGSVSVIDLVENKLEKIIKTGDGAEGVSLSSDGTSVLVTNRSDNTISVIDAKTLKTLSEFNSDKFPIRIKTTSDGKYVLISNAQSGDVKVFNAGNKELIKTIPMEVTAIEKEASRLFQDFDDSPVPVGILIHPTNKFAFVANTNADLITVIDLVKMEISGRLTAGKEPDGLGFSAIKLK
ncbi:MAG: beta-propeller fold lactonase family protein [Flavobacteriaceae bacterium]|nr:beta-propeller fold lactonase family protein [Bacteroidia bacterium]MBT8288172.1 beta-propeller fold lactonase family protein [Bacteroidia bacterium]NNF73829.1 beta-propeller fold lactonase family protein [Flavobacteriaceae bacterium]NNK71572.1 beta-propeller fold lactonase family protein [Flavobacteriaceae bacterium]